MSFHQQSETWEKLGKKDPLWAILSDHSKKNNAWDKQEFFDTGKNDAIALMQRACVIKSDIKKQTLLDFGCGVGRMAQAFADHFDHVVGVDISSAMIEHANSYNVHGDRCQYVHNPAPELSQFATDSFDFVYSCMVLQHNPPELIYGYIKELIRVLKPNGLLYFQLPCDLRRNLSGQLLRHLPHPCVKLLRMLRSRSTEVYEMYYVPSEKVTALVNGNHATILNVDIDASSGSYVNAEYFVTKAK